MKRSIWKSAGVLAAATFVAKLIGALYRIPLTNILGAEGMGLYQLIFPIYSFILSVSSGALPIGISVLVSSNLAKGDKDKAYGILNTAMSGLLITGIVLSLALVLLARPLGKLQGTEDTYLGYLAIAPAIFFVSGIAVLRGWFQGNARLEPSAVSQITEAAVKLMLGLTLAWLLMQKGVVYAIFGALLGVTASEAVTFLVMYIIYRKGNPKFKLELNVKETRSRYKEITAITIPMTVGNIVFPLTQIVDSLLVVNILSFFVTTAQATASYGLFTGPVGSLINFPIVIGLALGIAIVPQLTKDKEDRDILRIKQKCDTAVKLAFVVGVPFAIFYAVAARGIIGFLYPALSAAEAAEAARLLQIGAASVIFISVQQIYTAILQGLGALYKPVKNMAMGAAVKIGLDLALLSTIGINGVAIASLACFAVVAVLNYLSVYRLLGKSDKLIKNSGVILLCGVIMSAVVWAVSLKWSNGWWLFALGAVGLTVYLLLLLLFKVFTSGELASLPFGKQLSKLNNKFFNRG